MTNVTSPKRRFSCATDFTDEDCNRTVTISLETWTVAGEFLHSREKKNTIGNLQRQGKLDGKFGWRKTRRKPVQSRQVGSKSIVFSPSASM